MGKQPQQFYQHALRMLLTHGLVAFNTSQLGQLVQAVREFTGMDVMTRGVELDEPNTDRSQPFVYAVDTTSSALGLMRRFELAPRPDDRTEGHTKVFIESTSPEDWYPLILDANRDNFQMMAVFTPDTYLEKFVSITSAYYNEDMRLQVETTFENAFRGTTTLLASRWYLTNDLVRGTDGVSKFVSLTDTNNSIYLRDIRQLTPLSDDLASEFKRFIAKLKAYMLIHNNTYLAVYYGAQRFIFDRDLMPIYPCSSGSLYSRIGTMLRLDDFQDEDSFYLVMNLHIHAYMIHHMAINDVHNIPRRHRFNVYEPEAPHSTVIVSRRSLLNSNDMLTRDEVLPTMHSMPDNTYNWHAPYLSLNSNIRGINTHMTHIETLSIQNYTICDTCHATCGFNYTPVGQLMDGYERYMLLQTTSEQNGKRICETCLENVRNKMLNMAKVSAGRGSYAYIDKDYAHLIDQTLDYSLTECVHEHDFKPNRFVFSYTQADVDALDVNNPRMLYLGTEIEIDGEARKDNHASLIINTMTKGRLIAYPMRDGSLNEGFEIGVMPCTLDYHMNDMDYVKGFNKAITLGYRAHDTETCGLHVHINRSFLGNTKTEQNYRSALMALILERNWDDVVKFARRDYSHIQRWADKQDLGDDVYASDDNKTLSNKMFKKYGQDKYVAINMQHSQSVELRIFRGTLKTYTYLATLQFVSNLVHYVMQANLSTVQRTTLQDIFNYKHYNELATYASERGLA